MPNFWICKFDQMTAQIWVIDFVLYRKVLKYLNKRIIILVRRCEQIWFVTLTWKLEMVIKENKSETWYFMAISNTHSVTKPYLSRRKNLLNWYFLKLPYLFQSFQKKSVEISFISLKAIFPSLIINSWYIHHELTLFIIVGVRSNISTEEFSRIIL